jgi:hypothetical protein
MTDTHLKKKHTGNRPLVNFLMDTSSVLLDLLIDGIILIDSGG